MNPLDWDLGNVPPGIIWGGLDEAGRGAWAGPVVAACAVMDGPTARRWGHVLREVRDSKKLSPEAREALAVELKSALPAYGIAEMDSIAIDRENILQATLQAMRGAVTKAPIRPRLLFVDGDRAPGTGILERLIVDGDTLSCAIGAASVLAKTHRDALMRDWDERIPEYGFARHKGYGTPEHRKCLAELGASGIHRLSYAPVAAMQRPDEEIRAILLRTVEQPRTVEELRTWIETDLRPNYGRLKLVWVETLRRRYADRLAQLVSREEGLA